MLLMVYIGVGGFWRSNICTFPSKKRNRGRHGLLFTKSSILTADSKQQGVITN